MSLVDYGFYSDEENDAASSPSATSSANCNNPTQAGPESSPQNENNSLSESEVTCNSRASTPAPTAVSSRTVGTPKGDSSPRSKKEDGGPQGSSQRAAASLSADDGLQAEGETAAAETEEQRRALEEERAAVRLHKFFRSGFSFAIAYA